MEGVDTSKRLLTAQWVLDRQLSWITAADARVAAIVTINTAMLAGLAAAYNSHDTHTRIMMVLSLLTVMMGITALALCAMAIKPKTDGPHGSLLFFGSVAATEVESYQQSFHSASDMELLLDWSQQIHVNAKIANAKYTRVGKAIAASFAAASFWIAALVFLVKT